MAKCWSVTVAIIWGEMVVGQEWGGRKGWWRGESLYPDNGIMVNNNKNNKKGKSGKINKDSYIGLIHILFGNKCFWKENSICMYTFGSKQICFIEKHFSLCCISA